MQIFTGNFKDKIGHSYRTDAFSLISIKSITDAYYYGAKDILESCSIGGR